MGEHVLFAELDRGVGSQKGVPDNGVYSGGDLSGECGGVGLGESVEGEDGEGAVVEEVGVEAGKDED